ncbi:hypothetical protein [Streptomyces sp. enrichment culture]|uniref:hypothetical protein n=1 Tax=Streptomyces sp. enrichment culture TaxID=1795815 RepID=UPI003F54D33B
MPDSADPRRDTEASENAPWPPCRAREFGLVNEVTLRLEEVLLLSDPGVAVTSVKDDGGAIQTGVTGGLARQSRGWRRTSA